MANRSRRGFLIAGGILALCFLLAPFFLIKKKDKRLIKFGMIADVHYADREPARNRFYNQSLDKLGEFVDEMNREKVAFVVELGDFKDQDVVPNQDNTLRYLDDVESVFQRFNGPTYHVLGNHDMDGITKTQFLEHVENTGVPKDRNYYSFNQNGMHFLVLDGNYTGDGKDYNKDTFRGQESWIPQDQVAWIRQDLKDNKLPAIVFIHQLLGDSKGMKKSAQNAPEVRKIFEDSGKVLAVFEGHVNSERHSLINHIHYYSLISAVEGNGLKNSAYVTVEVYKNGGIRVHGFRKASNRKFNLNDKI